MDWLEAEKMARDRYWKNFYKGMKADDFDFSGLRSIVEPEIASYDRYAIDDELGEIE